MTTTATKKRRRRNAEQMIADLEAQIEKVRTRAAAKQAKSTEDGKALVSAVRAIDTALSAAAKAKNDESVRALEAARTPLSQRVIEMGVRLPDPKTRRGRKPKNESA